LDLAAGRLHEDVTSSSCFVTGWLTIV
jgi:hypothetical protein